ncbi:hypothetical protein M1O29_03990, partial [Dehalococcoidia bacterium]|nr:hypothetical protein [Dehalococcoidia bacterium]
RDIKTILDPSGHVWTPPTGIAPRVTDFEGKTVGLLDDGIMHSGVTMARIGELLRERHGVANIVSRRKPNLSAPAPKEMYQALKEEADFVVVGVGA